MSTLYHCSVFTRGINLSDLLVALITQIGKAWMGATRWHPAKIMIYHMEVPWHRPSMVGTGGTFQRG